jgi:RNA 3'-terminal phosphate cyclase (ATP)
MDGLPIMSRRWTAHAGHGILAAPHRTLGHRRTLRGVTGLASRLVELNGGHGEGGGQILRTALSLSLLTGRPFRIHDIRANREKPGLRPQHLSAVRAAAELGAAAVEGASVGSRALVFRPGRVEPRDLTFDIGTAGATGLVLQTLHLPLSLRSDRAVRLTLTGGTFNTKAPSFPFLDRTWARYMRMLGLGVSLAMPLAGFYPAGGGRLEAWIEPAAAPRAITLTDRGRLKHFEVLAGVCKLKHGRIAERMLEQVHRRSQGTPDLDWWDAAVEWPGPAPGAAIAVTAEFEHLSATFVGLGERGKPAEVVADEAIDETRAFLEAPGAVDPHSADQLLLPLAFAEGRSVYTVSAVTEHLRTNARTIRAFLDRPIRVEEPEADRPGRVIVG